MSVWRPQASLQERQRHVEALAGSLLGWPAPALAACCSAPQRALLLALHAPAALARGERRVKLTVRVCARGAMPPPTRLPHAAISGTQTPT